MSVVVFSHWLPAETKLWSDGQVYGHTATRAPTQQRLRYYPAKRKGRILQDLEEGVISG